MSPMKVSDYCLVDHIATKKDYPLPPGMIWKMRQALLHVDRKMHFTGFFGGMWKTLGVERSAKNPNVCNV